MRVAAFGGAALSFAFEPLIDPRTLARVDALDRALRDHAGVVETIPAYASLLVVLESGFTSVDALSRAARAADAAPAPRMAGTMHDVPVAYGGADGPDLSDVAAWAGETPARVIDLHAAEEYLVYMVGFTPGFPYMGLVQESIAAPRLPNPRARVPAGSVGIARRQTGIYPASTPGGWRLIGRTTLRAFDPRSETPARFAVGDRVRFHPVTAEALPAIDPVVETPRSAHGSTAAFAVVRPGVFSTIQDAGRIGSRRFGVPPSGAMDPAALRAANAAVGNAPDAAALEFAWPGPVLTALGRFDVAVAGADFGADVDGIPIMVDARTGVGTASVTMGRTIRFRTPRAGFWSYLAVQGAFAVEPILGSASTLARSGFGGLDGRTLRTGDILRADRSAWHRTASAAADIRRSPAPPIRVSPGPHVDLFPPEALARLTSGAFRVSARSDRSGYRLEGEPVEHEGPGEILSEGMLPGAVEVPPDGQPIVVMPDGPVTGGYPVLAVVHGSDLGRLAQVRPGEIPRFVIV